MFVVDAFTNKPFGGNPAAVCLVGTNVSFFLIKCISFRSCVVKLGIRLSVGQFRLPMQLELTRTLSPL